MNIVKNYFLLIGNWSLAYYWFFVSDWRFAPFFGVIGLASGIINIINIKE